MQVRWLKRGLLWLLQVSLVTGAAWQLLEWNYRLALGDLVPLRIPTVHHLDMLMLAMTLLTGGLAAVIAMIFALRVEEEPLNNAAGVAVCTCAALWGYIFIAKVGGEGYEIDTYFLGGTSYQVYGVIVVLGVALLNGVLSLLVGAMNPRVRPLR